MMKMPGEGSHPGCSLTHCVHHSVHHIAHTLGDPVDDKTDIKYVGIYECVSDKLYKGLNER